MAEVTPIGAAEGHVEVEDPNAEAEVVLVENRFELRVEKSNAVCEADTTPRVERAALELDYRVGGA